MYCVHHGKVSVMVYDILKNRYIFIPFRRWEKMTEDKRSRYREL